MEGNIINKMTKCCNLSKVRPTNTNQYAGKGQRICGRQRWERQGQCWGGGGGRERERPDMVFPHVVVLVTFPVF